jgi:hypothetical protein
MFTIGPISDPITDDVAWTSAFHITNGSLTITWKAFGLNCPADLAAGWLEPAATDVTEDSNLLFSSSGGSQPVCNYGTVKVKVSPGYYHWALQSQLNQLTVTIVQG